MLVKLMFILLVNVFIINSYNCETVTIKGIVVNYLINELNTNFKVEFPLKDFGKESGYWGAIALNSVSQMNDASAVVCIHSPEKNTIEHYSLKHYDATVLDKSNPTIGIKNSKIEIINGKMVCS